MSNIVFDIGGVLADFKVKEFLLAKGFDGNMIRRILKASVMSPYWEQFERGELTEEETLKGFESLDPEISAELREAFSDIKGMLEPRDFAVPLVNELKKAGHGVYYLSNYSKKAFDECPESVDFIKYTDGGLLSFRVGLTKPDPEMYRLFLHEFHLNAADCIFVDDTEQNVKMAEELGFQGILFTGYDELRDRLCMQ